MQQLQATALTLQPLPVSIQSPAALEQQKMEVCLIGCWPHSDVSPRERLQRGMQPSTHHAEPAREHTLATRFEDGMGKFKNLWFTMLRHGNYGQLTSRPRCNCFDLPRSKRSRNATSTILRICLCACTACVPLGTASQIDWTFPQGKPLCQSRVASSCRQVPESRYETKASVCRSIVARLHKIIRQRVSAVCRSHLSLIEFTTWACPCRTSGTL